MKSLTNRPSHQNITRRISSALPLAAVAILTFSPDASAGFDPLKWSRERAKELEKIAVSVVTKTKKQLPKPAAKLKVTDPVAVAASKLIAELRSPKGATLRAALKARNAAEVERLLGKSPAFAEFQNEASESGYPTTTVGFAVDASVVWGVAKEWGIALDDNGKLPRKKYETVQKTVGWSIGADAGLSIGWWKLPNNEIDGTSFGGTGAADLGVSVGYTEWYQKSLTEKDKRRLESGNVPVAPDVNHHLGSSLNVGVGVGLTIIEYSEAQTTYK